MVKLKFFSTSFGNWLIEYSNLLESSLFTWDDLNQMGAAREWGGHSTSLPYMYKLPGVTFNKDTSKARDWCPHKEYKKW